MEIVEFLILRRHKPGKGLANKFAPGDSKQIGAGKIGLFNNPLAAEGQIPHRGQIIEVKITGPRSFQLMLGAAQLVIPHLQFKLMYPQLMKQLPSGFRCERLGRSDLCSAKLFLCQPS
jgi:hypothetical protein